MVNIEDFIKRLEKLLDYNSMSASSFADKIGVQRSSMSHLLSGRNKPSLDFILKIVEVFPEVDLYWILNGKGSFPKEENIETSIKTPLKEENAVADLFTAPLKENPELSLKSQNLATERTSEEAIEKIVVFYANGTFKEFNPK